MNFTTTTSPNWHGVQHVALVTPNLDATITFYIEILRM